MPLAYLPDLRVNYRLEGPADGPVLVLTHAMMTDLSIWEDVIPLLPSGLRTLRYDHRGHGASDVPAPPYSMGALMRDLERLMDHLALRDAVVLGLSMGGLVVQGLAVKRPDLVRGLVLSNTAARIGTPEFWAARIKAVRDGGIDAVLASACETTFARTFRDGPGFARWRDLLARANGQGYLGCANAMSGADFYTPTSGLRLPALAIAGSEDRATPPDLVRETADLVPSSRFALIRGGGHIPFAEKPAEYAAVLGAFLESIDHV